MERYVIKGGKRLRCGYTTGTAAAGAAKAAARMLLCGHAADTVCLTTPAGVSVMLGLLDAVYTEGSATCAVRKDAGDDPDVTDGLLIYAQVKKIPTGFRVTGGAGVGRVTRPGLAVEPGESAINPVPLEMIRAGLRETAKACGYGGGLSAEISVPGGERVAQRTFNPRLGIEHGISILGTSGIVEPMSERAVVDTIYAEMDSHLASGEETLILCPGNYGRDFAAETLGIDLDKSVKCANFIGDAIDYAAYKGFREILLIGHAGKLLKLAAGVFNTHSHTADCRQEILAAHAALQGADKALIRRLMDTGTVDGGIALLQGAGLARQVLNSAGERIERHLAARLTRTCGGACRMGCLLFSSRFGELWRSANAGTLIRKIKGE